MLGPIWILVINSFKPQREIFASPARPPREGTLEGYRSVLDRGDFAVLFRNSILVTGLSI